jgi:hypothetical protein
MLRITGLMDFSYHPEFCLFLSSGEGMKTPTLFGPLERANIFLRDSTERFLPPLTSRWKEIQFLKRVF